MTLLDPSKLRNIAIIAHVDHGKTTLVDAMLKQSGVYQAHEQTVDRAMDSNDLERERGITILAKSTSVEYNDYRINIIDTPGHADFGGEVERTLTMADAALLLVDAAEGPLPQTRFVLKHALSRNMPIILVVNKIDRQDARPEEVLNEAFDLFCDLGATDEQADFQTLYTIGIKGIAHKELDDGSTDLTPLFDAIIEHVPAPTGKIDAPVQMLVTNIDYDEYVGRLAVCRIVNGQLAVGQQASLMQEEATVRAKIGQLYAFRGLGRVKVDAIGAGDVVALAGMEAVQIGDTIASVEDPVALPRIALEPPTIKVRFYVNSSPFAGLTGKYVTSRHLRERLEKESRYNLAMRFEDTGDTDNFMVYGRGELMISILVETMRREGYEVALANPEVVTRMVDGEKMEPSERVVIDVPDEHVGTVTSSLGSRKGRMDKMGSLGFGRTRLEFVIPSRALIGYRSQFLSETRGTGLLNTTFEGWQPYAGSMMRRKNGAMVADRTGPTTPYAIFNLEDRGKFCVGAGTKVYEGMVVGEHSRPADLDVNVCREKKMTNVRAAGKDENVSLTPHTQFTIETAMEFIDRDELIEITPDAVRIRKKILPANIRPKRSDTRFE